MTCGPCGPLRCRTRRLRRVKVFTVVGNRPQFIKAAALSSAALRDAEHRRGRPAHGAALVPRHVPGVLRPARPRRAALPASISTPPIATAMQPAIAETDRCRGARPRPRLRRHELDARRRARRAPTRRSRSRTWRPGCAAATSTCPEEHNRIETDRLAWLLFCPDDRSRRTLEERGRHGPDLRRRRCHGGCEPRVRPDRPGSGSGTAQSAARTSSRRSTVRQTSSSRGSVTIVDGLNRIDEMVVFPRAPADARAHAGGATRARRPRPSHRAPRLPRVRLARVAGPRRSSPTRAGCRRRPTGTAYRASPSGRRPSGWIPSRSERTCSWTPTPCHRSRRGERDDAARTGRCSTATATPPERIAQVLVATIPSR